METVLALGFILGLTSNLHCIGMCGPIALAIPVNRTSNWTILKGVLHYNFGRILTYSILGLLVGSIGLTIQTLGFLQGLSIVSGLFLIVFAWKKWYSAALFSKFPSIGIQVFVQKSLGKVITSKSPFKIGILGVLNGLLPCGMVYAALLNSLLAGNPLGSASAMIAFGIGTLPSMIAVGFAANRIDSKMRHKFSKIVPYLLTIVGLLIVLRGMNLGIPYVSPKVSVSKTHFQQTPAAEMSCCHKPAK